MTENYVLYLYILTTLIEINLYKFDKISLILGIK